MGKGKAEELIDELIDFIRKERELYGDFAVSPESGESVAAQTDQPPKQDPEKEKEKEQQDRVPEKSTRGTRKSASSDHTSGREASPGQEQSGDSPDRTEGEPISPSAAFDSQEKLFEQDKTPEVYRMIGGCRTLDELKKLCRRADVLKTDLEGTNLVFGVGNPDADLMLIGEAPGAEEDKQGEPFVGAAGQLLNKILEAIGFDRKEVYIANILKHRPPNNRNPLPEERQRSLPFLLRQIDLVDPKLILCLGKVSAQTLLDNDHTLSSMRGKLHSFRGKYELMATYHPAALLRHAKWKRPTWEDVQKLKKRYDELGGKP